MGRWAVARDHCRGNIGEVIEKMARPERFELPTYCSGGLAARRTNNLDHVLRNVTECPRCYAQQVFPPIWRHSVTLGKVWWWAQNWAQSRRSKQFFSRPKACRHEPG